MRFGTWNVRSLYRAGALDLVTSDRKETFGRPKRRWEDNIRIYLEEIGINAVNWVDSAQDRNYWRALVNAALNLWVHKPWS